jgi:sugar phosphate isomerase/epimerase
VAGIVVHPDTIEDPGRWAALGARCVLENMDARKPLGQTADDLAPFYEALPQAGLCLDVAHVASIDPSMGIAHELLDRFGARLRHLHVSSLVDGRHAPVTPDDAERFRPVLRRCVDVPWILEAPLP